MPRLFEQSPIYEGIYTQNNNKKIKNKKTNKKPIIIKLINSSPHSESKIRHSI